jgi:ATP-dependent Clp endopeptidase proteolytic subunit ClpP
MKRNWGYRNQSEEPTPSQPSKMEDSLMMQQAVQMVPEVVEVVENRIYFYADIDREKALKLNKTIDTLNNEFLVKAQTMRMKEPPEIYIYMNSFGGSIIDAFSILDAVLYSKVPINTVIDGCAASAATLISVCGNKRYIKPHSYMLIHQLSSFVYGKYSEIEDEKENLDKFMEMITAIYKKYTKMPAKKINEILKHDLWFSAEESIELGLADEILR